MKSLEKFMQLYREYKKKTLVETKVETNQLLL